MCKTIQAFCHFISPNTDIQRNLCIRNRIMFVLSVSNSFVVALFNKVPPIKMSVH